MVESSLRLAYGTAPQQFGVLTLPGGPGPHPVVVFIHGGFWRNVWDLSLAEPQAADAVADGYAAWNIEYRRVGDDGGGHPGTLADVAAAVDHLAEIGGERNLAVDRVAVVGHSAGGHLSFWVGQRARLTSGGAGADPRVVPRLVVGQAPVSDLSAAARSRMGDGAVLDMMGGGPEDLPVAYASADPARLLPTAVPQLIVHGDGDDIVPAEASRAYAARADVELIEFGGADHFDMIDPAHDSWDVVKRRISLLLNG